MLTVVKRLCPAVVLIVLVSGILLLSDLDRRKTVSAPLVRSLPRIAVMQIISTPLLDVYVEGLTERLRDTGYIADDDSNIQLFNPQGDLGTANAIAREIVNGGYDMVITASTVALQVVAKANQGVRMTHVFGAVTDPQGTGAGITGTAPDEHPAYMAGIGTFQPVTRVFEIVRELNPQIKRIGVVWNPGEQCSEACLVKARAVCARLGVDLVEATVGNTSEVSDALRSLLSRDIEAVWIGGDTVVHASSKMIFRLASDAGIPVFTNDPDDVPLGALLGLGADYTTVGQYTADIAVAIFKGKKPSSFSIGNVIPEQFSINTDLLEKFADTWTLTDSLRALAAKGRKGYVRSRYNGPARVAMINLVNAAVLEQSEQGVEKGLQDRGLIPGEDYVITKYNAQGDMTLLPQLIDTAVMKGADLLITVTTPALMAVANEESDIPVVFTVASDPAELGIFKNGRPDTICGVHDDPQLAALVDMVREYKPAIRAIGTIYNPAQRNAVISAERLRKAGRDRKITILESTASTSSDLPMGVQALIDRGAEAIIISADNLACTGFDVIHKMAEGAGIPIFTTNASLIKQGAIGCVGDDYEQWGRQSGHLAAAVLSGAKPSDLPIEATKNQVVIRPGTLADATRTEPFDLRMVLYSATEFSESCRDGLLEGLRRGGLVEGQDFTMRVYNAHGDMTTLSSIMTSVQSDQVDLLMVISTPSLQAALRLAGKDTHIVFAGVGDGVLAGAGRSETDHLPNVTGITTRSPFKGLARILSETMPGVKTVGTLFTPAEINSVLYKDWWAEALAPYNIELVAVPVAGSSETAQAADVLCQKDIQVIGQIMDNTTRPGFVHLARKADDHGLPVFGFDSSQVKAGGVIALSRDFFDSGVEAGAKAIRVLRGERPADIPFSNTRTEKLILNESLARSYKLRLSPDLLKKAIIWEKK